MSNYFLTTSLTLASLLFCVTAQAEKDPFVTLKEPDQIQAGKSWSLKAAAVTDDDVGDADSFGRNVKWAGLAQTKSVYVDAACVPDDYTVCATPSTGGALQTFDARDLATIILPAKTAHSLVCHHFTPFYNYRLNNYTGAATTSAMIYMTPYASVYNDALNDPLAIDPNTGLPYAGSLETGMAATIIRQVSLADGESEYQRENYTRSCIAGMISKRTLMNIFGLPEAIAEDFFKHETKIVFHLRGRHNYLDTGSFFYGMRLTVD